MSQEIQNEIKPKVPETKIGFLGRMGRLLVAVAVVAVVLFVLYYFVKSLIWWITAIGSILLLALNYKFVMQCLGWIKAQYQKNVILGVVITVLSIAGSSIFLGFLLLKTIWDFSKNKNQIEGK